MNLKPQDIVVALKLCAADGSDLNYQGLSTALFISQSEIHASIRRALHAGLLSRGPTKVGRPIRAALLEFLLHGVKYAFPADRGGITRGMPTAYAAPPLNKLIMAPEMDPPPVWPYSEGNARGYSLHPLYPTVPQAAAADAKLYEFLALVDAIRDGRARERNLAERELTVRLKEAAS